MCGYVSNFFRGLEQSEIFRFELSTIIYLNLFSSEGNVLDQFVQIVYGLSKIIVIIFRFFLLPSIVVNCLA